MHFRKLVSTVALLALVIAQIAIAQHSAVHIDHGFSLEKLAAHSSDDGHQDHQNKKHECPEFLLTKSLQTAFYNTPVTLFIVLEAKTLVSTQQSVLASANHYKANSPRAPPSFLI